MNDWFHVNEMRVEHEREQGFEPDRASFPTFEGFADSLDWRHVDGKLSARALTFANEIRMAGDSISAAFDFDTDDGLEEMRLQAGRQGTRALDLVADLRKAYGLPSWNSAQLPWDYAASIREGYAELLVRQEKRKARALEPDDI
jgi:hypothetical protein